MTALKLVDTRRNKPGRVPYCLTLTELPQALWTRDQAQKLRAELIHDGVCLPTTYVSGVILSDGTPVWRIAEPWLV